MPKHALPRDEIVRLYLQDGLGMTTIARRFGVTDQAIYYQLRVAGVPRRTRARPDVDGSEVVRLYESGLSTPKVAALLSTTPTLVATRLKQAGVPRRAIPRSEHPRRRATGRRRADTGGRIIDPDGYVRIRKTVSTTPSPYEAEHRLVWEKTNGRKLQKGEIVHHINGIRSDNRPENLMVMTISEHMRHHAAERRAARARISPQLSMLTH